MASVLDSSAGPGPRGPDDAFQPDRSAGVLPRSAEVECRRSRLRAVFDLASDAPLPPVDPTSLVRYYQYLAARLTIPFHACHAPGGDKDDRSVRVLALLDPREWDGGQQVGLLCAVEPAGHERSRFTARQQTRVPLFELEVPHGHPNYQLLEDYWYWFWNWRNQALGLWA